MVQNGYRAVYEPRARATENMTTDIEDEFRRKVRMFEHAWLMLFRGRMFGLRGGSAVLGRARLAPAAALLERAAACRAAGGERAPGQQGDRLRGRAGVQLAGLAMVALSILATGPDPRACGILHYYLLVTLATVIALGGYLRRGVPATWDKAAGTRL